jgi:uncharacterized protein (DUF1810 family)
MPDMQRFIDAQDGVYAQVVAELRRGRKTTHWMWFILPQIVGLGHSEMSRRYAISSVAEAREYAAHPVLGARLRECVGIVLGLEGRTAMEIFGSPDNLKFHSSMTLFDASVPEEPLFGAALDKFFSGQRDAETLRRIGPK